MTQLAALIGRTPVTTKTELAALAPSAGGVLQGLADRGAAEIGQFKTGNIGL